MGLSSVALKSILSYAMYQYVAFRIWVKATGWHNANLRFKNHAIDASERIEGRHLRKILLDLPE